MSHEILHEDLDDFLKNSFEGHTIVPGDELWARIEPQITLNMVPHAKYVRMKYAFIATAASLVAVVFLLFTQNTSLFNSRNQDVLVEVKNSELSNLSTAKIKNKDEKVNTSEKRTVSPETKRSGSKMKEGKMSKTTLADQSTEMASVSTVLNQDSRNNAVSEIRTSESILPVEIDPMECQEMASTENCPSNTITELAMPEKPVPVAEKTTIANRDHRKSASSFHIPKIDLGSLFRSSGNRNAGTFDLSEFLKKIEVGFNYSPLLSSRTMGQTPISGNNDIDRQYFNNIEKALLTGSYGLDLMYKANDKWAFRSGFYFSSYRHETQNDALHREVISPDRVILNTSAGKIPVNGTGMDQLPILSVFNARINLSYLEVPFDARYYWYRHLFTDAGMNYAFLRSSRTTITTEEYTGAFSYSGLEGLQKHALSVSLGFGLDYKINKRIKFEIGPEIKWQVNSISASSMNAHPLYWGIRAGIRFKLGNPGYRD